MADRSFLGWPFFDEAHRAHAAALEDWARSALADVDHGDPDAACRKLVADLGRDRWLLATAVDPADPASRLDVRTLCLSRETLARHDGLADFAFAMQGLGTGAISLFGTAAQQQQWLPHTRSGAAIAAFALTEPGSGSDVANGTMTATEDGADFVLNGEKTWISNGGIADVYTVFARTGEAGAKGLSAFVMPAGLPGFSVVERLATIAPHPLARLRFEGVRIPGSALLGQRGEGFKIAMSVLDVFRATVAAAALGFARRALDEAVDRVQSRRVMGEPLAALQMVQGHIADMAVDIDASALLTYRAAWAKDMGAPRVTREAAMAKLFATEQAQQTIDKAVQLFGAEGVRCGATVERLYREIRALRIYEGASDVQRVIIARQAMAVHAGG
jgi:acyl-CoA dehydrogenase